MDEPLPTKDAPPLTRKPRSVIKFPRHVLIHFPNRCARVLRLGGRRLRRFVSGRGGESGRGADGCSHAYPNPVAYAYPNARRRPNARSADGCSHAYPNSYAHAYRRPDAYPDADGHSYAYPNPIADADAYPIAHADAYSNARSDSRLRANRVLRVHAAFPVRFASDSDSAGA